ncbi:Serpin B13 [Schistosoma haematobium]|uniref:Serpin B13 n=1 Tax=Schistosoma haematobium TaxID=6185 RepID=A0A922LG47_SCHHA|nr:Serpin B13 [Schistosoma haematobium]KAH9581874.1 Serpin B13 [Schistosoma haematobium]
MDVIQSLRNFSEKLYREILKRNEGYLENTFLSPFNIYTALGMIFCGSANNTNAELIKAMLLPDCLEQEIIHSAIGELLADLSKPDESVEIIIENRFYVNEDVQIEKRFRNIIKQHYNALTEHVAFHRDPECARNRINQWVSEQTNGTIQELIPRVAISQETSAVVLSITYFKGSIIYIFKSNIYYLSFYFFITVFYICCQLYV